MARTPACVFSDRVGVDSDPMVVKDAVVDVAGVSSDPVATEGGAVGVDAAVAFLTAQRPKVVQSEGRKQAVGTQRRRCNLSWRSCRKRWSVCEQAAKFRAISQL